MSTQQVTPAHFESIAVSLLGSRSPLAGGDAAAGNIYLSEDQQVGLAARMKDARKAAKITQAALAKQLGLKTRHVQEMERGEMSPCLNQVREIAAVLEASTIWLWFGREVEQDEPVEEPAPHDEAEQPAAGLTIRDMAVELQRVCLEKARMESDAPTLKASREAIESDEYGALFRRRDALVASILATLPKSMADVASIAMCMSDVAGELSAFLLGHDDVVSRAEALEKGAAAMLIWFRNAGVPLVGHMADGEVIEYEIGRQFGAELARQAPLIISTTDAERRVAEIERLHAIEMDPTRWPDSGDLAPSAGDTAQRTMWPLMEAALADPATIADVQLLARVARCVIESAGNDELPVKAGRLLAETVLSRPDAAGDDAELIAECAAFDALEHQYRSIFDGESANQDHEAADFEGERNRDAQEIHLDRIMQLRATTLAGLRAKATSAALEDPDAIKLKEGSRGECLMVSIVEDLISGSVAPFPAASPDPAFAAVCDAVQQLRAEADAVPTDIAHEDAFHEVVQRLDKATLALAATPAPTLMDLRRQAQLIQREVGSGDLEPAFAFLKQLADGPAEPIVNPDADYIALCNEIVRLEQEWQATGLHQDTLPRGEDAVYEQTVRNPIAERASDLFDRLCEMQPQTASGQHAAARAALAYMPRHDDGSPDIEINHTGEKVAWMLVKQLAGRPVPLAPHPDATLIAECDQLISLEADAAREAERLSSASDEDWHEAIDPIRAKCDQVVDHIETMVAITPSRQPASWRSSRRSTPTTRSNPRPETAGFPSRAASPVGCLRPHFGALRPSAAFRCRSIRMPASRPPATS